MAWNCGGSGLGRISGNGRPNDCWAAHAVFRSGCCVSADLRACQFERKPPAWLAAADRVFAVLDYEPKIVTKPDASEIEIREGGVRFENIGFSYDGDKTALSDLSLNLRLAKQQLLLAFRRGEINNIEPNTTVLRPDRGRVIIDNQPIEDVTLDSLRHSIALVSQEITMFNDTVRANIAYGRLEASRMRSSTQRRRRRRTSLSSIYRMVTIRWWASAACVCPAGNGSNLDCARNA